MAYPGYGGGYGGYSGQMPGMQMQMGQPMPGTVPNMPHSGYSGYSAYSGGYSASDPMWTYFTAIAGQGEYILTPDVRGTLPQSVIYHVAKQTSGVMEALALTCRELSRYLDPLGCVSSDFPTCPALISPTSALAFDDGEVDAEELQRCLTQSGISGTYSPFSLETCRIMISMLDRDFTGKMGFSEFKELWAVLNAWKQNFMMIDQDRSGTVELHELSQVIAAMGYRLSPQTLTAIVKRYSKNGRIFFDDYVACCVKLRALTDFFRRRDSMQQGFVNFVYDDGTMAI